MLLESERSFVMFDVPTEKQEAAEYECLDCGTIVTATSNPGECPNCERAGLQHRGMSLE